MEYNMQWFLERVGKKIYRQPLMDIEKGEVAIQVLSKAHAKHLFNNHHQLGFKYYDK